MWFSFVMWLNLFLLIASQDVDLVVEPEEPAINEIITMTCAYDHQNKSLYNIRFYKDYREFYRYTVSDVPSHRLFPLADLNILHTEENVIKYQALSSSLSEMYSCEVSYNYDQEGFLTVVARKNITVLPTRKNQESKTKSVNLTIEPEEPLVSEIVRLTCRYDRENRSLYTIRVYKDYQEFYRYTPSDVPCYRLFPVADLNILNMEENVIMYQTLNSNASGIYSCEVSYDYDQGSFVTVVDYKNITVLAMKEEDENEFFVKLMIEPEQPSVGDTAKVTCNYNIGSETLYAIRFYKDAQEFFRFHPSTRPSHLEYFSPDIKITKTETNVVHFQPLDVSASGVYSCEVTSGEPSFRTEMSLKNITVVPGNKFVRKSELSGVDITIEPEKPSVGDTVKMTCNCNAGNSLLYALKFYKDSREFFRFSPNDSPSSKVFLVLDLKVIKTGENYVEFKLLNLNASGVYTCEVMTDAPLFQTATTHKIITLQ